MSRVIFRMFSIPVNLFHIYISVPVFLVPVILSLLCDDESKT